MKQQTENQEQYLLFTNGAYDKNCYPVRTADELAQLTGSEYFQRQLADYRAGDAEAKRRMLALIPQGRLRHGGTWLHQAEHLVPSGWVFLDDDRPCSEITAEERHRLVEERLAQLGLTDMPHVAMRSASMKYHLLVPMITEVESGKMKDESSHPRGNNLPLSSFNSQLRKSWERWCELFEGVLVLDPSTVNVNRLMFFTGEVLTPPESVAWLFKELTIHNSQFTIGCAMPSEHEKYQDNICQFPTFNFQLEEVAARIVEQLCGSTTPPEGMRNNTLYEAARQMAYVEGITEEGMMEAFAPLAYLGLPQREALQCIRSAMRHEKTWKYTLPRELAQAIQVESGKMKDESSHPDGNNFPLSSFNFQLNSCIPELIRLFTAHVPDNARQAVSSMVFAPLGAYLNNTVTIRDVSNKQRNLQFTSIVVGNSSSGKGFVDYVSDFITRRLRQHDAASWAALDAWQEQKRTVAKGEPQPMKPTVPLHLLSSNMTEPALLERLKALEPTAGRAYIKAAEIDELRKFQTTGSKLGGGQDIILSAFDTASYGALRVSAEAVSTMTVMSVNICASSTYPGTQEFFRQGVERGSVGRCDFSIVDDSYDVPLYHDFTPEAARQLDVWIDRLENATGEIVSPDIDRLIEDIRLSYHDPTSPLGWKTNPEYFKLCHRQLLITKQKATLLYICNDYQWDPTWEPWLTEAFYYGMQCKISIFAAEIASWAKRQNTCVTHIAVHGPKSELADLPDTFTLADLVAYKRSKAPAATTDETLTEKARAQLRTWTHRGRIVPTGTPHTWSKA